MTEKSKRVFTNDEKKQALDFFNTYDGGRFKTFVLEAGNDKNTEKGAEWDKFTRAYQQVCTLV